MRAVMNEQLYIYDSFHEKELIKDISGRKWDSKNKAWVVPKSIEALELIIKIMGIDVPRDVQLEYDRIKKINEDVNKERLEDNEPLEPMPIKGKPYQHQKRAYSMACMVLGLYGE